MAANATAWWYAIRLSVCLAATALPACGEAAQPLSNDMVFAARWIHESADNAGMPYAVVDKRHARIVLFGTDGNVIASSNALLGQARGDASTPGIETRDVTKLRVDERITPAGRFDSQPGHNIVGEDVVWVDYAASLAIHRLRPADPRQRRPQRLASVRPADKRVSLGCVVVPVAFYEQFVRPLLGRTRGVVYVLPEEGSAGAMFESLTALREARAALASAP